MHVQGPGPLGAPGQSCLIVGCRPLDPVPVHFNAQYGCCVCIREPAGGGRAPARGMPEELRWCCGFAPAQYCRRKRSCCSHIRACAGRRSQSGFEKLWVVTKLCTGSCSLRNGPGSSSASASADVWHMCTCAVSRVARPAACRAQRSPVIARCAQPSVECPLLSILYEHQWEKRLQACCQPSAMLRSMRLLW